MEKVVFSIEAGQIVSKGAKFSPKELERIQNVINRALSTEQANELKALKKADKAQIVEKYKGLFSTFNFVKKNTDVLKTFKAKGCKVQPVHVLGVLNFNEFIGRIKSGGAYSIGLMYELCARFDAMNEGQRIEAEKRGEFLNSLIEAHKKGEKNGGEILSAYAEKYGYPIKERKNGGKVFEAGKTSIFFVLANGCEAWVNVARTLKPEICAEYDAKVKELAGAELIETSNN